MGCHHLNTTRTIGCGSCPRLIDRVALALVLLGYAAPSSAAQQSPLEEEREVAGTDAPSHRPDEQSTRSKNLFGLEAAPLTGPLVTDRPDFTESTDAVPTGWCQLEAGYTYTYDSEGKDRVRDHTAPELLLRIGLAEDFELRIGWAGYSWRNDRFEGETRGGRSVTREDSSQGAQDLSLGFKLKLFEQEGWRPHFGIIGAISIPSGSAEVSSGDVDPEVVLLWAYDITDSFAIASNVGLGVPTEDDDRFVQATTSLSGAFALSDTIGAYIEYYGFYTNTESSDAAHTINGGLTYLLTDNFQIDWRIGMGLNEEADDFFTGIGFSWRF